MTGTILFGRSLVALLFTFLPVLAAAECQIYKIPSICDPVAQDSQHWISEYSGQSIAFTMQIDGMPIAPNLKETGILTIFAMSGGLVIVGDGGFQGEADLVSATRASEDAEVLTGDWSWLSEDEMLAFLQMRSQTDTDDSASCPLRWWPRWTGDYQPPDGPTLTLTLIATTFDQMLGRLYYSGPYRDGEVVFDSRFTMRNNGFDPTGYSTEVHMDGSQECQTHCTPGSPTFLCAN